MSFAALLGLQSVSSVLASSGAHSISFAALTGSELELAVVQRGDKDRARIGLVKLPGLSGRRRVAR